MSNSPETTPPSISDQMPTLAAEFVRTCKAADLALDYLPRTLPLVDRYMNGARGEVRQLAAKQDPTAATLQEMQVSAITAYLGEVILRETGAFWYDFDDRPFLNVGDYQADPKTAVAALFERGKAREGDLTIDSTKAYCELICRMQRHWLDGTVLGTYDSMSALRSSMTPDARLAGFLVGQAQLAVKTAKMQWQQSLDFSDDSLDAIERILGALHALSKKAPGEGLTDEQIAEASKMWGVYLGEVIRRHYGGQWSTSADGELQIALSGTTANPVFKVSRRIVGGTADNVRFYFASIAKALSS